MGDSSLPDPALLKCCKERSIPSFLSSRQALILHTLYYLTPNPESGRPMSPISQIEKLRPREAQGFLSSVFTLYTVPPFAQGAGNTETEIESYPCLHRAWSPAVWKPHPLILPLLLTGKAV